MSGGGDHPAPPTPGHHRPRDRDLGAALWDRSVAMSLIR